MPEIDSIDDVLARLASHRYIGDRPLATSIYLALKLGKPLFIEGEAGVGKAEAAKVMPEVLDALKRRCLYHWIDYPDLEKEVSIVEARVPEAAAGLARQVALLVSGLREMDLYKLPGVAETLDWAHSLSALGARSVDASLVEATLGAALKYQEDLERAREAIPALVQRAQGA